MSKLDKAWTLLNRHRHNIINTPDGSFAETCHHRAMFKLKKFIIAHKVNVPSPYERIYLMD